MCVFALKIHNSKFIPTGHQYALIILKLFMPNLKNAKKALKQAKKRAISNLVVKNTFKKTIKTTAKAIVAQEKNLAEKIRLTQQQLDKAAKKGVIKKNTASRKLSRLMKKANAVAKK